MLAWLKNSGPPAEAERVGRTAFSAGGFSVARRVVAIALAIPLLSLGTVAPSSAGVTPLPADASISVLGHGWGHGRGMGQWGADGMARSGSTDAQILTHYYSGVSITARPATEDLRALVEESTD